jgi:hypothetical protein
VIIQALRISGLTIVGVLVGVTGAFIHSAAVDVGPVSVPYGLVLAVVGVAALLVMAHLVARTRVGVGAVAAGWLLPVVVLSQARPAGDVVIASDTIGMVFLFGGVVLVGLGLGLPPHRNDDVT